ncbi:MAG TPA: DUF1385 domain-containing protein [Blastocatellia bacterium]|nr:DUF1385 domain-containing protein [Blastocatellia bacterium]
MSQEKEIIVGGQAVMEGVMMRAPNSYAVAVRRQDGSIIAKSERLPKLGEKYPILRIPVLRGGGVLIHSMVLGIKALNFSATVAFEDLDAESGQKADSKPAGSSAGAAATTTGSLIFGLLFNVLLFVVLPLLLTNILFIYFGWGNAASLPADQAGTAGGPWYQAVWVWLQVHLRPVRPSFSFNLVDGVIRMLFFVLMIFGFSRLNDFRRIFEYHGAEHKTVYTWEAGEELTVANARRHPRQHPRCGTSFLMVVMLVSIILFSIVKFDSLLFNLLTRVALVPLIAGLSYEVIRAAGQKETGRIFSLITRPGIWLQNLTTREPSDDQLEVAIYALKESLKLEPQSELKAA